MGGTASAGLAGGGAAGAGATSRSPPHLWQIVAVTLLRVPQWGQEREPIFRISSSSRSQSSNVRNVGWDRHQALNSSLLTVWPSSASASPRNFCTTSSYCIRIFWR